MIIGSGMGGLVCADILSREGYKVCVLEKNKQAAKDGYELALTNLAFATVLLAAGRGQLRLSPQLSKPQHVTPPLIGEFWQPNLATCVTADHHQNGCAR